MCNYSFNQSLSNEDEFTKLVSQKFEQNKYGKATIIKNLSSLEPKTFAGYISFEIGIFIAFPLHCKDGLGVFTLTKGVCLPYMYWSKDSTGLWFSWSPAGQGRGPPPRRC